MQNIIIEARKIRRELFIWLFLLVVAFVANIYAISTYSTAWSELYSSMGYVFAISLVLYAIVGIVRLLAFLILKMVRMFI